MDIIDIVTYHHEDSQDPEIVRQAFCSLFDADGEDARIVMKHLTSMCRWEDETEYNDPIINAKFESLHGLVRNMKKQLNRKPIELNEDQEEIV